MQKTIFNTSPYQIADYFVYHDESGTDYAHSRYIIHGALFIPKNKWQVSLEELNASRLGYSGRIHFVDLRDNTSSVKGEAAWNWMTSYFGKLSYYCPYKCMVIDAKSKSKIITRFTKPYLLYNYSAMLAIRSALPWSFGEYDQIRLNIYSESTDRSPEDNFSKYVPRELVRKTALRETGRPKCPSVIEPINDVQLIPGNPKIASSEELCHCEFIQLTDLLTSAVAQAINASSTYVIKIELAEFMAKWIEDTRMPPWIQDKGLHRRFSVSCFPDSKGNFYNVPLSIKNKLQMDLF
jgi:hypothetical protein